MEIDIKGLAKLTADELSKLPQFSKEEAGAFYSGLIYNNLNDQQNAAIALSQNRKIMPEENSVPAINRHLPFDKHIYSDVLWNDDHKKEILEKVLDRLPPTLPRVPENIAMLAEFSPKKLAEMPSLNEAQALDFYKNKIWEKMDPQQVAVMALSQSRRIIPEQKFVDAINKFLPQEDKVGWDIVVSAADEKRSIIDTIVKAPSPQAQAQNSFASRLTAMLGMSPQTEKKPVSELTQP